MCDSFETMTNEEYYNPAFVWYVLYVMAGQEQRVKQKILEFKRLKRFQDRVGTVLVPIAKKIIVEHNKRKERVECIFSSYIFIQAQLNDDLYNRIKMIEGTFYFLGMEKRIETTLPLPMSKKDVDLLFNAINKFKETDNYLYLQFSIGDYVKIASGVFKNCRGRIKTIHNNMVAIESEYMNAADIRSIPIHTIEKIDKESMY